jgi:hypothetical protein
MIQGGIEVTGRQGRRHRKLLNDLKERRGYSHLKEEALNRTMWRARFGRGFGPVVRQTTKWINTWGSLDNSAVLRTIQWWTPETLRRHSYRVHTLFPPANRPDRLWGLPHFPFKEQEDVKANKSPRIKPRLKISGATTALASMVWWNTQGKLRFAWYISLCMWHRNVRNVHCLSRGCLGHGALRL